MATRIRRFAEDAIAAVAAIFGAGSLVLFGLFLWNGPFGILDLRLAEPAIWTWDASLCLLFFVQHSGMVRKSFRVWLSTIAPSHVHGIIYTIASSVALLLLAACWQPSSVDVYVVDGAPAYVIRGVLLLSLGGVLWGIGSLGEFDAFGIETFLSHVRGRQPHPDKLIIRGPYRLVRHPFYGFGIITVWASPVLSLDRLVFNFLFTAWIVLGATLEERDLLARFGEQYRLYQHAVPMLIPRKRAHPGRLARGASSGGGPA